MLDIKIRPEELYFLGELMQAQYINYEYIAAMPDISQAYAAEKTNAIRNLGERGLVSESLRGGIRVSPDLQTLLRPVFFSKTENSLRILTLKPEHALEILRFHVLDGSVTMMQMTQKQMKLTAVTEEDIRTILQTKLRTCPPKDDGKHQPNAAECAVCASSSKVGVGTHQKMFLLQGSDWYCASTSGELVSIPADVMIEQIVSVLKEA